MQSLPIYQFYPKLGGRMDLAEKRRRMAHFHFVEMELMEILASWSETMVYIPVRAGAGQHIWEQALHCERISWALKNLKYLGRVLRTQAPSDNFVRLCERIWATPDPALRLVGLYKVIKPALIQAYQQYIEATDHLADMFSVQVLSQCIADHTAHIAWAERMLAHLLDTPQKRRTALEWQVELEEALHASGGVLSEGAEALYLPYEGWPEHPEAVAARQELRPATGQWRSSGYTYVKSFERGIVELQWDGRFSYARSPDEVVEGRDRSTVDGLLAWLHTLFHGECQTVDRMGWVIVDFPDLPFEMRKDLAQQAWEEARHIGIVAQLIEGLGGRLGMHPFPPYWGRLRRDYHHPVQHMVLGNIMGEGGAAAATNDALEKTVDWGNDWLRRGLEHLSADEVVHINFGKKWGKALSAADPQRHWQEGLNRAIAAQEAMWAAQEGWGARLSADARERQLQRIRREFEALRGESQLQLAAVPAEY